MLLSPATAMACMLHAALLAAAATLSAAQRVVVGDTLQLPPQFIVTGRSQQQVGGRARQAFSTTEGLRPLKLFFYGNADSRGPATNAFLADRLLPAAASILGRSIRVRFAPRSTACACMELRHLTPSLAPLCCCLVCMRGSQLLCMLTPKCVHMYSPVLTGQGHIHLQLPRSRPTPPVPTSSAAQLRSAVVMDTMLLWRLSFPVSSSENSQS